MACANVANLLLARAEGRQREISVRAAIGAGKARLTRQLLTESFVLAIVGAAARARRSPGSGVRLIAAHGAAGLPALAPLGIEPRMLLFAAALSILTTFLFGFAPAVQMLRLNLTESLRDERREHLGGPAARRDCAACSPRAQMALAVLLLLGAGLMLRSLDRPDAHRPRLRARARAHAPAAAARGELREAGVGRRVLPRSCSRACAAFRACSAAGIVRLAPARGRDRRLGPGDRGLRGDAGLARQGRLAGRLRRRVRGARRAARARPRADAGRLGRRGRRVVLVNETLAQTYWPGQDPIGKRHADGRELEAAVDDRRRDRAQRAAQRRHGDREGEVLRPVRPVPDGAAGRRRARHDARRAHRRRPDVAASVRSAPRCGAWIRTCRSPTCGR